MKRSSQAAGLPSPPDLLVAASLRVEPTSGSPGSPEPPRQHIVRVWDVERGQLDTWTVLVARPDRPDGTLHPTPGAGDRCTLSWVTPAGVLHITVQVRADERSFGPVWVLIPIGTATREQRRAYFRVPMAAPLTLHLVETGGTQSPAPAGQAAVALKGTLVDLGEGGLFATTRQRGSSDIPDLAVGDELEVGLELDDGPIRPAARVLRIVSMPGGSRGVALQFTRPEVHGPGLRRTLVRVQRQRARERSA